MFWLKNRVLPQESAYVDQVANQDRTFDASNPLVLVSSEKEPIIAYLDEGPVKESQHVEYMYDYTTSFTLDESSHRGLGFHDETETTGDGVGSSSKLEEKDGGYDDSSSSEVGDVDPEAYHGENAEMVEDLMDEMSPDESSGYVIIGGTKIYTHDTSDEEDNCEEDDESSDDDESRSSLSEDDSATSGSDDLSYSGSDIDDELAEDYIEGIGGTSNFINVDQLTWKRSDEGSDSENSLNETLQKLGGIDLQEASMEYGVLKKPGQGSKYRSENINIKSTPARYSQTSALDDLVLVKDIRSLSGKKKHVARAMNSWPSGARKSKKHKMYPGKGFCYLY